MLILFFNTCLTIFPTESWFTETPITIYLIDTPRSIVTRQRQAFIHVILTVGARISYYTGTLIAIHPICTCAIILAWSRSTLIDVKLTQITSVTLKNIRNINEGYKLQETISLNI